MTTEQHEEQGVEMAMVVLGGAEQSDKAEPQDEPKAENEHHEANEQEAAAEADNWWDDSDGADQEPGKEPGAEENTAAPQPEGSEAKGQQGGDKAKAEEGQQDAQKAEGDAQDEPKDGEGGDDKSDGEKPPKGYVPLGALKEERESRKALQAELAELRASIDQMRRQPQQGAKTPQAPTVNIPEELREDVAAFSKEFPDLAQVVASATPEGARLRKALEEDGPDGLQTMALAETYRTRNAQAQAGAKVREAQVERYLGTVLSEMETVVPGLFKDEAVQTELVQAAQDVGMDKATIDALTDPATVVVVNGQRMLLGHGAVSVIKALNAHRVASKAKGVESVPKADVDKLVAEALEKGRSEGAAVALKKLNNNKGGHVSIGDAPMAGAAAVDAVELAEMSEEDFARLSPRKRRELGLD